MFNKNNYLMMVMVIFFGIFNIDLIAQDDDEDVEEVVVTGSRIATSEFTGAQPVIVIDEEDIANSVELSVAEVLRELPINTAGSFYERSGSSASSQATISLRGIGSGRTLVLIDGRRVPSTPKLGGESANINTIPTAGIERIEVLADGASAVYGSDAIGGVVNIITKKGFDGMIISGRVGDPDLPGGEEEAFSIVGGVTGEDSNITWSYEHSQRDIIYLTDRDYTGARAPTDDNLSSGFSNSTYAWNYVLNEDDPSNGLVKGQYLPAAECLGDSRFVGDGKTYILGSAPAASTLDHNYVCAFDYTQIMARAAGKKNDYFTLNYDKEISDDMSSYFQAVVSRQETFGRYAPPASFINPFPAGLANARIPAQADGTPERLVTINVPVTLRKRFIEIGPRASEDIDYTGNIVLGFTGEVMDDYTWDLSMQWHMADYIEHNCCYSADRLFAQASQAFKDNGEFTVNGTTYYSLFDQTVVDYYKATTSVRAKSQFKSLEYTFGGPLTLVPDTDFIIGVQSAEYQYENNYDKQSEIGNTGGGSGNSDGSGREYTAYFYESKTGFMDGAGEVDVAVRYDDYSDFGTNTSYTVKALYEVMDGLTLRFSTGTGFRAPGLGDLVSNTAFSAEYHTDYVKCNAQGIARDVCPEEQVNTDVQSNPNLGPEESESTNFGVIYQTAMHSVAVDFFNTEIDGVITYVSVQDYIDASILGSSYESQLRSQGTYCDRLGGQVDAPLTKCYTGPINGNQLEVSGTDINYSGTFETTVGDFDLNINAVLMDESNQEAFFNGPVVNYVGLTSLPELRYQVNLGHTLQAVPNLYLNLGYEFIDEVADTTDANYKATSMVDSMGQLNVRAVYTVPGMENLSLTLAVKNATKEDPPLASNGTYNRLLHPIFGMQTFLGFKLEL